VGLTKRAGKAKGKDWFHITHRFTTDNSGIILIERTGNESGKFSRRYSGIYVSKRNRNKSGKFSRRRAKMTVEKVPTTSTNNGDDSSSKWRTLSSFTWLLAGIL
jgi:hypothetical protein